MIAQLHHHQPATPFRGAGASSDPQDQYYITVKLRKQDCNCRQPWSGVLEGDAERMIIEVSLFEGDGLGG